MNGQPVSGNTWSTGTAAMTVRETYRAGVERGGWTCNQCHKDFPLTILDDNWELSTFARVVAHKLAHHRRLPRGVKGPVVVTWTWTGGDR